MSGRPKTLFGDLRCGVGERLYDLLHGTGSTSQAQAAVVLLQ